MSLHDHYILMGHVPVVEPDFMTWVRWVEGADRRVAITHLPGEVWVSTVFLGLDHNFGLKGDALVFETMIFGGEHDGYQTRSATWNAALEHHRVAVKILTLSTGAL